MKLYEFEGKRLLSKMNIPVPHGEVAATGEAAIDIAARIGYPVVLKSQVLQGGRGKARGIRFAQDPQELTGAYKALSNLTIGREPVSHILIEEKLTIVPRTLQRYHGGSQIGQAVVDDLVERRRGY